MFVHGFVVHPERTWTHKKGDKSDQGDAKDTGTKARDGHEPPTKVRRIHVSNPFSQSRKETNTPLPVYWPRDLLPKSLPDARVLTFGYNAHVKHGISGGPNTSTIYDIA